jgi:regulator of protease activity HflC (stomatin/prohibitin superfamily)
MFGLLSITSRATDYVFLYSGGKLVHQGAGLSGLLFAPFATAAVVPIDARDDIFAVESVSADFQTLTIQGLISHRISDPNAAVKRQDFSVRLPSFKPHAEPMKQIAERLKAIAQTAARETLAKVTLDDALTKSGDLSAAIMSAIQSDAGVSDAGVAIDRVLVLSIKPAPEIRKALEADIREKLLRNADAAVFDRRRAAAADEHDLKLRNEESAAELARAEISNAKALEGEKLTLAKARAETIKEEAASAADAERLRIEPWTALSPAIIAALGLKEWAGANASLTSLTISGDSLDKIASALADTK